MRGTSLGHTLPVSEPELEKGPLIRGKSGKHGLEACRPSTLLLTVFCGGFLLGAVIPSDSRLPQPWGLIGQVGLPLNLHSLQYAHS